MPSLTPKIIGGHTYYYARYCQRVDGKPKIVRQVYLGKIDDLVAAASDPSSHPNPSRPRLPLSGMPPLFSHRPAFGLGPVARFHPPGQASPGPLRWAVLAPGRHQPRLSPTSKLQFADWYRQTVLTRLLPTDPAALSSQNFWNHMDLVTADHVLECEKQITQRLIQRFQLDLRALVYDGTNFFTYINTRTPAELPQRGHNKQKRGDLRQVSLGLLVSADFHIPLFHKVYAGNVNDSTEFRSITEELSTHYQQLAESCDHITLVFDKGNNSEAAFESCKILLFISSDRWSPRSILSCSPSPADTSAR